MDANTDAHTHLLGTYTVDGYERHILALESHASDILEMIDVIARPIDGDADRRQIENRVTCLGECQAIADDYLALADKLGWTPMPDVWW